VEGFFYEGLQSFAPAKAHYDLIWIQWVIGYLTDGTSQRARSSLVRLYLTRAIAV
jgi:hypothetical protein